MKLKFKLKSLNKWAEKSNQSEFISQYENGIVIKTISAESILNELMIIYADHLLKVYPVLKEEMSSDIRQEVNTLINKNASLQFEVVENEIHRNNLLIKHNNELSQVTNELSRVSNELSQATNELSRVSNELSQANNELSRVSNELKNVYKGRSWKITKPIRKTAKT